MALRVDLLDHGYVQSVEHYGSDEAIIEAARMSTGKGFLGWGPKKEDCRECSGAPKIYEHEKGSPCPTCRGTGKEPGDEKLLRYLYTEKPPHSSPFEMAGAVFELQAPIMVFREWHRHRTQSYNEMSGRYTPLPDINYIPSVERMMLGNDGKNKQAGTIKDADVLTLEAAQRFRMELEDMYQQQERLYQHSLKAGVPKELARVHLGVGRYSRMRASANLLNWTKFLALRMHSKAQWEIRQYANAVSGMLSQAFPRTMQLFEEGRPK